MNAAAGSRILTIRPAMLGAFVARATGLDRRRWVASANGQFHINPVSVFGTAMLRGEYEPGMNCILEAYLRPGDVFVDLGANEGYFSVKASTLVGVHGTVVAVEPQSRLLPVLHDNFARNQCLNVRLVRCVLSDKTGVLRLSLAAATNNGSSSLLRGTKYRVPTEEVQSFTLADFFNRVGLERCDLMKVDIEGSEYDVLMAAAQVLRSGIIRNIALEFHPSKFEQRGVTTDELHQHLIECGYRVNTGLGPIVYSFASIR